MLILRSKDTLNTEERHPQERRKQDVSLGSLYSHLGMGEERERGGHNR